MVMQDNDIFDTYHELPEPKAFRMFKDNNISKEILGRVLGFDVAFDYKEWLKNER